MAYDDFIRALEKRCGERNVRHAGGTTPTQYFILSLPYPGSELLRDTRPLTWQEARYIAEHPELTDKDLIDGNFPGDWPRGHRA